MIPYWLQNFKSLTQVVPSIFCLQDFHLLKCLNLKRGHNSTMKNLKEKTKKYRSANFLLSNEYMKFQNPSIHGSKDMRGLKKQAIQTDTTNNGWTEEHNMDKPKAISRVERKTMVTGTYF